MRIMLQTLQGVLRALLVMFLAAPPALADPVLQQVVRGEVSIEVAEPIEDYTSVFDVRVTDGSIANYSSFDIAASQRVNVEFAVDGGSHLARVISVDPTTIEGSLFSNGHVYLVNPAGVYFGAGASFDVVGLHAAAGKID